MDFLNETYERTSCEIGDLLQHQNFDKQDVEMLGELIDIVKDIEMIYNYQDGVQMYDDNYMRGRSGRMMPMNRYNNSSYMRGRSMNSDYGRTDNKEMLIDHLHNVASTATDEKDRKAISRLIEQMDSKM